MGLYNDAEFFEILCRVVEINCEGTLQEDLFFKDKILNILLQLLKIGNEDAVVDTNHVH
jgi:hypothetical protein